MGEKSFAKFDDKEVRKFLSELTKRAELIDDKDKKYIGIISALVYADIINHFKKEAGPDDKWEEWSSAYADHMERIGKSGNKKLQDSGHLRQALKPVENGESVRKLSTGILWFNNAKTKRGFPYAYAHDNDDPPAKRKQLPQRSFMWLSDKGLSKIQEQTLAFLVVEE